MKIKQVTEDGILFDNDKMISCYHSSDCCEHNYADFEQLNDLGRNYDFDEQLYFEKVDGSGFRFGDNRMMFFIPCYSEPEGYYSDEVDIYWDGIKVLTVVGELRLY